MTDVDPRTALAEVQRRRRQTLEEGSAPWPWRFIGALVAACVTIGAARDADMNWFVPWLVILLVLGSQVRGVQLPPTARSRWWAVALGTTLVGTAWLGFTVMHLLRTADWPLPGTTAGVVAALAVLLVVRPVQVRAARSLRR